MTKRSKLPNESNFLQALQNNDPAALESLYREVFPQVAGYVLQNSGEMNDAQDVFQDAVVVALRYLKKPDFKLSVQFNTFLVAIARNMWLKRLRQMKRVPVHSGTVLMDILPDESDLEAEMTLDHRCAIVVDTMAQLGEECRKLLVGFYFEKKSLAELAAELGYTDGFVRIKKGRCLAELRKRVENHPDFNA